MAAALQTTCNNQNTLCTPCSFSKARRFKEFGGKWRDNRQAAVARIATETYREGQLNVATSPFIAMEERGLNLVGPHCTSPSRQALAQKCTTTTFGFILGFLPFLSFLVRHSSSQTDASDNVCGKEARFTFAPLGAPDNGQATPDGRKKHMVSSVGQQGSEIINTDFTKSCKNYCTFARSTCVCN